VDCIYLAQDDNWRDFLKTVMKVRGP